MKTRLLMLVLVMTLCFSPGLRAQDTNWVKNNTWYFDNFVKDTLPWSIFRETFIGVAPAPSADFDQVFYSAMYQTKLAGPGHCYGMDVMAMLMLKNGGCLGYCHPPYVYAGSYASNTAGSGMPSNDTVGPTDRTLRTAIEIIHGYQINHGFLSYLLDVIVTHKSRDGRYTFDQTNFYLAKNDQPVLSITKGLSPADGGHVLIPYFTENLGATKRIYVYDPNRSFYEPGNDGHEFYTTRINFIEVNNATGQWKYNMGSFGSPVLWQGDPGSGGHCIVIPLSVAGRRDRLPQSLLADGAYALNTIFIFANVKVEQVSDPKSNKNYLNAEGNELEPCDEKRLDLLRFIPLDGTPSKNAGQSDVYFFRGGDPVRIQYRAWGDYKIGMIFKGKYYEVKGNGRGERQVFEPTDKYIQCVQ